MEVLFLVLVLVLEQPPLNPNPEPYSLYPIPSLLSPISYPLVLGYSIALSRFIGRRVPFMIGYLPAIMG